MIPPIQYSTNQHLHLAQWVRQSIALAEGRIETRLKGNTLHVLCEATSCPPCRATLRKLINQLLKKPIQSLLPVNQPDLHRIIIYGRERGQASPNWTETIELHQLERYLEELNLVPMVDPPQISPHRALDIQLPPNWTDLDNRPFNSSALVVSNLSLAKQGNPNGIARYLSETLSQFNVGVQVTVKTVDVPNPTTPPIQDPTLNPDHTQRLRIFCTSLYSPDATVVAEPLAQQLRQLELQGYRDAVVHSQVIGEPGPDWVLRIDLTPANEMLRNLARWGDVDAICRLINEVVQGDGVEVRVERHHTTLYCYCQLVDNKGFIANPQVRNLKTTTPHLGWGVALHPQAKSTPLRSQLILAIAPLLRELSPQGIHGALIWGMPFINGMNGDDITPQWVHWVTLPTVQHPELAISTRELAEEGDLRAIAFLLNRQLNPDLDWQLATGGIRVQLLRKHDLLLVMLDGPLCPIRRLVAEPTAQFLRQLRLPKIAGVRIFGRRAGQQRPLWSVGLDFINRHHRSPETFPECVTSQPYGEEFLPHNSVKPIIKVNTIPPLTESLTPTSVTQHLPKTNHWQFVLQHIQQALLQTYLFVPFNDNLSPQTTVTPPVQPFKPRVRRKSIHTMIATGSGLMGLLLTLSMDWMSNQWIPAHSSASQSPIISQPTPSVPAPFPYSSSSLPPKLTSSQQALLRNAPNYPSFNNLLLDEKLNLYRQHLLSGPPDILIVGSSRAMRGVDPSALRNKLAAEEGLKVRVFNFGINGATGKTVDMMIREILKPSQLPRLIIWADGARAFNGGRVDHTHSAIESSEGYAQIGQGTLPELLPNGDFLPALMRLVSQPDLKSLEKVMNTLNSFLQYTVQRVINDRVQGWDTQLNHLLEQVYSAYSKRNATKEFIRDSLVPRAIDPPSSQLVLPQDGKQVDFDGFLSLPIQFQPDRYYENYAKVPGDFDADYDSFRLTGQQTEALQRLAEFTRERKIGLIFVNLPLTREYLDPTRLKYEQEFKAFMAQSAQGMGFTFLDFSQSELSVNGYFSDPSHLNRYGGYAVSGKLVKALPWQNLLSNPN